MVRSDNQTIHKLEIQATSDDLTLLGMATLPYYPIWPVIWLEIGYRISANNKFSVSPPSDQVQKHDVRVDGDVVPVHVVRDGARGEEGQLQGARQRGQIRDTDWRMGKPFLLYCFFSLITELIGGLKFGNVRVFVQLIFGPCWSINQLNKNPNID